MLNHVGGGDGGTDRAGGPRAPGRLPDEESGRSRMS